MRKRENVILFILISILLVACSDHTVQKNEQKQKTSNRWSETDEYPYANSTDIYSAEMNAFWETEYYQCKLDGTEKRSIYLGEDESGYGFSILSVSDAYLYFFECEEDEKVKVWRVPLKKGEDGRDIVSGKPEPVTDWIALWSNFAIVDDYFLKAGNRASLIKNIDTGKEDKKLFPESLNLSKKKARERDWFVLGKGKGWVLWGGSALMLQMVPSNECIVLETKDITDQAAVSVRNNKIYYALENQNGVSCWMYDIASKKKEKMAGEEKLKKELYQGLAISEKKMKSCKVDRILLVGNKCYMQFIVSYSDKGKTKKKYCMLSINVDKQEEVNEEKKLNQILGDPSLVKQDTEEKTHPEYEKRRYLGHIGDLWYIQAGLFYCYNEKTEELKEIRKNDPEYNMYFAISKIELGTELE